jgi:hypothetical protein
MSTTALGMDAHPSTRLRRSSTAQERLGVGPPPASAVADEDKVTAVRLPMSYSVPEVYDRQRAYLREQLVRALGSDWVEENEQLLEQYWEAVVTLGYALPDER